MKILLVRPLIPKKMTLNVMPPIGLGYLAASVRKKNVADVSILDCLKEEYDSNEFLGYIKDYKPDVVGFQAFSHDVATVNEYIGLIKKINPSTVTIVGGPHPSGTAGDCLRHIPQADFAFSGEAEAGLPKLIKILEKNKSSSHLEEELKNIPGLIWRREGGRIVSNEQIFVEDLDSLEPIAWDLINPVTYPDAPQGVVFRSSPIAPIMITRGCPYRCTFCAGRTISGVKIRRRTIKNVLDEIQLLFEKYGIREIHILDDNFTIDKNYVQGFCQGLIDKNFRIWWCCPNGVSLDTLDRETLALMKKSGCYYISVGIESGSDRILKLMKKRLTTSKIRQQIEQVKKTGFDVNGFFIIGYPGETEEDILATIKFARSLPLTRAAFYNFLPLPGTEVYQNLRQSGQIDEPDWGRMFQVMHPYCPEDISEGRLDILYHKAYRDFYARPKIILALLKEIKTLNQLKFIGRRARVCLGLS